MVDGSCNVVRPAILMRSCFPYDPPRRAAIRSWKIFEREREREIACSRFRKIGPRLRISSFECLKKGGKSLFLIGVTETSKKAINVD